MIYPLTVQAERLADKPALIDDRADGTVRAWTFAELNRQANRLANVFRDLGLAPGERFIWCGPNSPEIVFVSHARAKVGATAVPLNYRLTPEETAYIVEDSDAVLIYADAEQAETFAKIRDSIPRVRHIAYNALDPETMLLFYSQVLGLREVPSSYQRRQQGLDNRFCGDGKTNLAIHPFYSRAEGHEAKYGINHIGFLTRDMQAVIAELQTVLKIAPRPSTRRCPSRARRRRRRGRRAARRQRPSRPCRRCSWRASPSRRRCCCAATGRTRPCRGGW